MKALLKLLDYPWIIFMVLIALFISLDVIPLELFVELYKWTVQAASKIEFSF